MTGWRVTTRRAEAVKEGAVIRSRTGYLYEMMPARSYDFPPKEEVSLWHLHREGARGINTSAYSPPVSTHWLDPTRIQKARESADLNTGQPPGYKVCGKGKGPIRGTETK